MKFKLISITLLALAGLSINYWPVQAHRGVPGTPAEALHSWNTDPLILAGLILTGLLYLRGELAMRRRTAAPSLRPALAMTAALFMLVLALVSPLDASSGGLFAAHMIQHMILVLIAAPLLVAALPLPRFLLALPSPARRKIGAVWAAAPALRQILSLLTGPTAAWVLHALALWFWHIPYFYELTLSNDGAHALEHLLFLVTAVLFWWAVMHTFSRRAHLRGAGVLYVFSMALISGLLGALITFAPQPWISSYQATAPAWGLTPLQDQQLAGVIMWVPAGVVYLLAAVALFARWLSGLDRTNHGSRPAQTRPGWKALLLISLLGASFLSACSSTPAIAVTGGPQEVPNGDIQRGRAALEQYGCGSCHWIPGVTGATALVGPPLSGWAHRQYVAGQLTNTPENLIRWIMDPQQVEPGTAMPDVDVVEPVARDMAAYLYSLTDFPE